ncbi:hypothetical protein CFOL_v3_01213 [Cephalotus follicularis]|uniref:Uncharacterized protein n=1 Tax=Cephalotus follicularis TaxID=3775 RepID=A0A1Q3API8_CEPFO|nr:hypothetical protein CFOL_v3_01213 [Cephalotus follicularis]
MADLLRRAEKYVNTEEAMAARRQKISWSGHRVEKGEYSRSAPEKKEKRKERSELPKDDLRHKLSKGEEYPKRGTPIPNYKILTPLLESRRRILAVEKEQVLIQWPAPLRSPTEKRDTNKYCQYHQDHRHDMEECMLLKNQIKYLICKGHLREYVDREAPRRRKKHKEESTQRAEEPQTGGVIH